MTAVQPLQPFRWFGSKTRVANEILSFVPPRKHIWVELFAGSGIVTIVKPAHPQEHLNDLDGDVFNLFNILRDEADAARLVRAISLTPYCEREFLRGKYEPPVEEPVERARRFLVAAWQGMGGGTAAQDQLPLLLRAEYGSRARLVGARRAPRVHRQAAARRNRLVEAGARVVQLGRRETGGGRVR